MRPDKSVCYGGTANQAFAIDAQSGKLLWQKPVFAGQFTGNMAFGDSMLFATTSDNRVCAVNPTDGTCVWSFDEAKAPPCIPLARDGIVYVGSLDTCVYALDARTGKLNWKLETGGRLCGQPCVVGEKLYCTSDDGSLTEIELPR